MAHMLVVSWPRHAFPTSEDARRVAEHALSDASKAMGVNEPLVRDAAQGVHLVAEPGKTLTFKAWRDEAGVDHVEVHEVEPDASPINQEKP